MKPSRRNFARVLAAGAAAPLIPNASAQATPDAIDLSIKVINVPMNEDRAKQVREALQNTLRQVQKVRAYPVKRDTEPALGLGIFDN